MQRAASVSVCALLLLVHSALCIKMNMLTKEPKPVPKGKYPFMVSLFTKVEGGILVLLCTGSIVHRELILTAAHCMSWWDMLAKKRHYQDVYVFHDADGYSGPGGRPDESKAMRVSEIYMNTMYLYLCGGYFGLCSGERGDIALLRLKTPLQFDDTIQPIGWISNNVHQVYNMTGINYTIAGYGNIVRKLDASKAYYNRTGADGLYEENNYSLARWKYCRPRSPYKDHSGITREYPTLGMCTLSPKGGASPCEGDSGGPIFYKASGGPAKGKYVQTGVITHNKRGEDCDAAAERRTLLGTSLACARGFYDLVLSFMASYAGKPVWTGPNGLKAYQAPASGRSQPDCERNTHLDPPDQYGRGEWFNYNTHEFKYVECDRPFGKDNPFLANYDQML